MKAFYCDHFTLLLPAEHRFPMSKYRLLREVALGRGVLMMEELEVPDGATDQDILRVHGPDYLERVQQGRLDRQELRRIGFPWSPELVERSRRSVGGTLAACRAAFQDGTAANLAGGTHHAFRDRGEGFCVFNDVAIAARAMQVEEHIDRVLIVDCDVHQGNGTASIFSDDPSVFTLSLHGRRNFPFRKETSDLDVEFEDGTGDDVYLEALTVALERALNSANAELVLYVSGADPYRGDQLGRLSLSKDGLARRDRHVIETCRDRGLPIAVVMAGGYAAKVEDIVDIHLQTLRMAAASQAPSTVISRSLEAIS